MNAKIQNLTIQNLTEAIANVHQQCLQQMHASAAGNPETYEVARTCELQLGRQCRQLADIIQMATPVLLEMAPDAVNEAALQRDIGRLPSRSIQERP